jgi:hypothetical protein
MKYWNVRPTNRSRKTPFSPASAHQIMASANAPSITHQITRNIPAIFIQRSPTPASSFQGETVGQPFQAGGDLLGIFTASTRERSGSTSSSCSSVTSDSSQLDDMNFLVAGAFPPLADDIPSSGHHDPTTINFLSMYNTGPALHSHDLYHHQAPADNSSYRSHYGNPLTDTLLAHDRALPRGGVHATTGGQIDLPVLHALEAMLMGENQPWNDLWSVPVSPCRGNEYDERFGPLTRSMSPVDNSSRSPPAPRGLHVGNQRTWAASEGIQDLTADLDATFLERAQSSSGVRHNAWTETVISCSCSGLKPYALMPIPC